MYICFKKEKNAVPIDFARILTENDMIDKIKRGHVCVCVCGGDDKGFPIGYNHVIHLNNANLLITDTRWTSEAEVVHRQYLIINQFAIVDTNYQASGKVKSFNLV